MSDKNIRFIHAADLHIDSPFKGITNLHPELAERLKDATYKAFENIIDLCIDKAVDFLLIAGDIYDSDSKSLGAQIKFKNGMERLSQHNIPAFIVHGNHDPLDKWSHALSFTDNVYIFKGKKVQGIPFKKNGVEIARIYGISFHTREIKESLVPKFNFTRDLTVPFTVGLIHANVDNNLSHDSYAPCSLGELLGVGLDYWALGHIHKHQVLRADNPAVVYSGNPQGRNPKEVSERGCYLVELNLEQPPLIQFVPVDLIRFKNDEINISECSTSEGLMSLIDKYKERLRSSSDGVSSITRISLTGISSLHSGLKTRSDLPDIVGDANEGELLRTPFVWIDQIRPQTAPIVDVQQRMMGGDFIASMLNLIEDYKLSPALRDELKAELMPLFQNWQGSRYLDPIDKPLVDELLEEARFILTYKLIEDEF